MNETWTAENVGTRSLEDGSEVPVYDIRNEGGDVICEYVDEDNAQKIAAVTHMLAALRFVSKYIDMQAQKGNPLPSQLCDAVHDAIRKATT